MRAAILSLALLAAGIRPALALTEKSPFEKLLGRVSGWLNDDPIKQTRLRAAVAAVRGGHPIDQGEDLDQKLLDAAISLRKSILAGDRDPAADARSLRAIYHALAVSEWSQSLEAGGAAPLRAEVSTALRDWLRKHPTPDSVTKALRAPDLTPDSLVAAGWGPYCRSLVPALREAPASQATFDAETLKLDEAMRAVQRTWTERDLDADQRAQAHSLAGQVYEGLAQAPLVRAAASAASKGGAAVAMKLAEPSPAAKTAPARGAPPPENLAPAAPFDPRTLYARASKAVVVIICSDPDGSGEVGTGSFIDASGRVLTNAHVVVRGSTGKPWPKISVYVKPAKLSGDAKRDLADAAKGQLLSWDSSLDLALVQVDRPAPAFLGLADPEPVEIGDRVAAIGHPEQGGLWTLTTGVVSALVGDLGGVAGRTGFQTDASINRGNSGGPLLDAAGGIIGVNTLMSRKAADGLAITAVNFAVRSDVARRWLASQNAEPRRMETAVASIAVPAPAPAPVAAAPVAVSAAAIPTAPPAAVAAVKPPAAPAKAPKPQMITESKPYSREQLIEREIEQMEQLEQEMHEEVEKSKR